MAAAEVGETQHPMRVALDPNSGLQWMNLAQATLNAGDIEGAEALAMQSMQAGYLPAIF